MTHASRGHCSQRHQKLKDQLAVLDRNVLAIEKARDAYRQQFDIGQRSLLDLLNAEKRAPTRPAAPMPEPKFDPATGLHARTQAARNTLLSAVGVAPADDGTSEQTQGLGLGRRGSPTLPPGPHWTSAQPAAKNWTPALRSCPRPLLCPLQSPRRL